MDFVHVYTIIFFLNTEGLEGFSSSLILLVLIWSCVTEQLKKSSFGKK